MFARAAHRTTLTLAVLATSVAAATAHLDRQHGGKKGPRITRMKKDEKEKPTDGKAGPRMTEGRMDGQMGKPHG
jgi:hypothetical protein